jgi:hypothetical protein
MNNGNSVNHRVFMIHDVNPATTYNNPVFTSEQAECWRRHAHLCAGMKRLEEGMRQDRMTIDANVIAEMHKHLDALAHAAGHRKSA